jgi:hypothetical protein
LSDSHSTAMNFVVYRIIIIVIDWILIRDPPSYIIILRSILMFSLSKPTWNTSLMASHFANKNIFVISHACRMSRPTRFIFLFWSAPYTKLFHQ